MKKTRECIICGAEFSGNLNARYCPECREDQAAKQQERERLRAQRRKGKTIEQILCEVERYNRENGTRITYGQYVDKFENKKGGKLK